MWTHRKPPIGAALAIALVSGTGGAAGGRPTANSNLVTSNTTVLLSASVYDVRADKTVVVIGLVPVQAKFDVAGPAVELHAVLRDDALVFTADDPVAGSPQLQRLLALRDRVKDLGERIAALSGEIRGLQQELYDVLHTDSQPWVPGVQIDRDAANRLQNRLAQLTRELEDLRRSLRDAMHQIEVAVEELRSQQNRFDARYRAQGVAALAPAPYVPGEPYQRLVAFDLVRPDRSRQGLPVLVSLKFTDTGILVTGDATSPDDS